MCKIIFTEKTGKPLDTVVYNIAMGDLNGRFSTEDIEIKLKLYNVPYDKKTLSKMFIKWIDSGMIYDNILEYVVYA